MDQLTYLIEFTAVSLFLLIEMHAFDERATWLRRRIGDPSQISALYLRGGAVFILVAMTGSLLLTQRAASAPLAGAWDGIDDQLIRFAQDVSRLFPVGGAFRGGGGVRFGSYAKISDRWFSDEEVAFTATVPAETEGLRWRAATYDTFALDAWIQDQRAITEVPVPAGALLLGGTPEDPKPEYTLETQVTVKPDTYADPLLLAHGAPTAVSRAANLLLFGDDGWFAGVNLPGGKGEYMVNASILRPFEEEAITGNLLRAASEEYPADVALRYTDVPEGAIGNDARELLAMMLAASPSADPYDLAETMQAYLSSDRFRYTTDLTGVECDDPSAVECFARTLQGYCLHYASTMAILLREANPDNRIPTRLVQGFLPGDRATASRRPRRSATGAPTPGSRSTSRATAGSRSTRRAAASAGPRRSPRARWSRPPPRRRRAATRARRTRIPAVASACRPATRYLPRDPSSRRTGPSSSCSPCCWPWWSSPSRSPPGRAVREAMSARIPPGRRSRGPPRGSASARDPRRPSTSTRPRSGSSCPWPRRTSAPSPRPRWRPPTRARAWAERAWTPCATPPGACGSRCSGSPCAGRGDAGATDQAAEPAVPRCGAAAASASAGGLVRRHA